MGRKLGLLIFFFPDTAATELSPLPRHDALPLYEGIYLRPESVDQAARVVDLLRALVDHFTARPTDLPSDALPEPDASGSDAVRLAAVRHVSGMTDRYACRSAMRLLGWEVDRLPAALDFGP